MASKTKPSLFLRCENHQEELIKSFRSLLSNGRFTDVTLAANGKFLSVHRVILSAYSPYFEELLSLHEESQTIVFLQVPFEELQMLVDFMYKGEIEIESGKVASFFDTAQSLKIRALQQQGREETTPSMILRIPEQRRDAECPVEASGHDAYQASGSSEAAEEIQAENSNYALESEDLQSEGSDNEDVLVNDTASIESGEAQQSFKQEPESFEAEDFNHVPSTLVNNSSSPALDLPKIVAKSRSKRTRLSLVQRFCFEKQYKAQRTRKLSKVQPGVETKDSNDELSGDSDDETSSATSQYGQIEVAELPGTWFKDSGTTGNDANDLEATGPSGMINQTPGQGNSNANSRYSLRKRTSAVILQSSNSGSLPGTSRSESGTLELSASASSSVQSNNSKLQNFAKFVCPRCYKSFKWHKSLIEHKRFVCGKEPTFACDTCDKRFHVQSNLQKHRDGAHELAKSVCSRCGKSYQWSRNLVRHERMECGKEPSFECVSCDKRFYQKVHLKSHMANFHKSGNV